MHLSFAFFIFVKNYSMNQNSTICAISTPPGKGAIAVIRISGKETYNICEKIFKPSKKEKIISKEKPYTIHHGFIHKNNEVIDEVLISLFKAPHSFTGEDMIEISCHGSPYIQQQIMQILIEEGAQLAKPGEFSLRAFLNGKIDLSQAEAIADLIASTNKAMHDTAIKQMRGHFSSELKKLRDKLLNFISLIELELDFSEEDVEFADRSQLKTIVNEIKSIIDNLLQSFEYGNVLKNGIQVAIIGKPNVGKSTLLNAILKEEKAIVSEIAGTTRDAIEDVIIIDGIQFRFIDTAGLRETDDMIESLGIKVTHEKITKAKIILWLADAEDCLAEINKGINDIKILLNDTQRLFVLINKIDKYTGEQINAKFGEIKFSGLNKNDRIIKISAKKHINFDVLYKELINSVLPEHQPDIIINNIRHYEALKFAADALTRVNEGLNQKLPNDLLAQDIRETLHYLGEITGEITTDEILGNIFKNFCIGK